MSSAPKERESTARPRILLVDLNNFSLYPTIGVGYLTAILRRAGMQVVTLCPLAYGIPGVIREPPETAFLNIARRTNFFLSQTGGQVTDLATRLIQAGRTRLAQRRFPKIARLFAEHSPADFDVVLVSAYLMYHPVCIEIGRLCQRTNTPLVIGGSYFAVDEIAEHWLRIPGLTALVAGEVEHELCDIVSGVIEGKDISRMPGVYTPGRGGVPRSPLVDLDSVPFPDYSDFPWQKYPHRLIPIIAGRGCGWGVCNFCSDVASSSGRTFRSRSPANVLEEIQFQSDRHNANLFVFTDLKLNSDLSVWEALIARFSDYCNSPRWVTAVHVGTNGPNGLDGKTLKEARRSGLVRLTTGLESGSQRILDSMIKGTSVERTSEFLRNAAAAGISLRVTMIHGFPDERADDVMRSADFLERHSDCIDRVRLNRFMIMLGTTFERRFMDKPSRYPSVSVRAPTGGEKTVRHSMSHATSLKYIRATQRLLGVVHQINSKKLPPAATEFNGVM